MSNQAVPASGQARPEWWADAVVYQIYRVPSLTETGTAWVTCAV
ncbi:hypothetical protein G205_07269 [Arthrobacter nitrophenolicus]|uniref:Uncharacterized protein n=1 Tax=Arthrobacter nitrophenolicus TaxID=683150 RepID=L8TV66_9MICC|nr:hypothetical protein G205_07269 [Arthrobacter nitrophenolicus]